MESAVYLEMEEKWLQGFQEQSCDQWRRFSKLDSMIELFEEDEFDQEADALAKNSLDHKPKPKMYLAGLGTGESQLEGTG
jgi:hypothetical protein